MGPVQTVGLPVQPANRGHRRRALLENDLSADYGPLNDVARDRVNTNLIRGHGDDLRPLAGSLKLGLVRATSIMRTVLADDRIKRWLKSDVLLRPSTASLVWMANRNGVERSPC